MSDFENQLRGHLRRKQPPAGFVQSVLAKSATRKQPSRRWALGAIAASLALAGGLEIYHYQQGQFAKQQVMLALRITSEKSHVAQMKIDQINQRGILP